MARRTYYLTREQRNPLYRTRMLQAGPIDLDESAARLYRKLGVEMSDEKPKGKAIPTVDEVLAAEVVEDKPANRVRRRKKSAK